MPGIHGGVQARMKGAGYRNVFKALISLKKDPDRLVLSADKGNCVVVMDKHQYREKALSLLGK